MFWFQVFPKNSKLCQNLYKNAEDAKSIKLFRVLSINNAVVPDALFDKQWPLEKELVDFLCANCHKLKENRDGYK